MAFSIIAAENGVKYLKSDILPVTHGFSTRVGGVSTHVHTSSLNLAFGRGDDDATVLKNLGIFSDALDIDAKSVISRTQIHSARVVYASEDMRGEGYFKESPEGCDGYVTDKTEVALGIKTADCVPILFCDADARVIGAVHAGWRGTASGIAAECVKAMCSLGANAKNIRAAIGPAIHFCCYEVGEDFVASVTELAGAQMAREFIRGHEGKLHADIVGMNRRILIESGMCEDSIDVCECCTCCEPAIFYSHRFSGGTRGTMLSVISL